MLTTTLDGLWVLQVLSGIEVLAPELGLRPHLPSTETRRAALENPVAAELHAAGAITDGLEVDEPILEWLTVLARRDVALLLYAQSPAHAEAERILLARFDRWWVALERCGAMVRFGAAGTATSEKSAAQVIEDQIDRLCGTRRPAAIRPVILRAQSLLTTARSGRSLRAFLFAHDLDADQVDAVSAAADPRLCSQVSIVAMQSGTSATARRSYVDPAAVTIHDTPRGRLLSEQVSRDGTAWLIIGPGSTASIGSAVNNMMRRLPAREDWHSHRKAV